MRRRASSSLAALVCLTLSTVASVALLPSDANAFCRTRVDGTKARKEDPESKDGNGCYGTGNELYWRSRCISYQFYPRAELVSANEARQVIADAFAKWTQTSCALQEESGKNPDARISLDVRDLGGSECARAGNPADKAESGYNKEGPNQNLIIFRDDSWPYAKDDPLDQSRTLGLTTVTYDDTGEIRDADMELNSYQTKVKVRDIGPEDYDLASIITHEAGHFLGIAHSNEQNSTMFFEYQPGETRKQFLKLDDINAVCEAYAPGTPAIRYSGTQEIEATTCDPTPQGGVQRTCEDDSGGCAVSTPGAETTPFWLACGAATLGISAAWRRRRSAGRRNTS